MVKNPFYDYFIVNLLQKTLLDLRLIPEDSNMNMLVREQRRKFVIFWMDMFLSGLVLQVAAFFLYVWVTGFPPLWALIPLTFSYGTAYHYFLNWLPKPNKPGVRDYGSTKKS